VPQIDNTENNKEQKNAAVSNSADGFWIVSLLLGWKMKNAVTIDLEDYYQVSAFSESFAVTGGITIPAGLSIIRESYFPFLMREMHGPPSLR